MLSKSTVLKKYFSPGEQLLEEQHVDIGSIFTKQSDNFFCFKGVFETSLRKQNRIILVKLAKDDGTFAYAYCQCPAGNVGTCSHAFAVMKLVTKCVIDKINKIPEPIPNTNPSANTRNTTSGDKGITSSLYYSRTESD